MQEQGGCLQARPDILCRGYIDEAKTNVAVNLEYLHLMEDMDRFNSFAWGSNSFEQLHDRLSFAALRRGRVEGDGAGDEEEEEEVKGTKHLADQHTVLIWEMFMVETLLVSILMTPNFKVNLQLSFFFLSQLPVPHGYGLGMGLPMKEASVRRLIS